MDSANDRLSAAMKFSSRHSQWSRQPYPVIIHHQARMWQLQRWWWFCECYQCVAGLGLCACRVGWMHGVYLLTPSCWRAEAVLPSASPLGTPVPPARVTERPSGGSCATCVSRSTPEVPGAAAIRGVIDRPVIVWCESGLTGVRRWRRRCEALSQGAAGVRRPTELRGAPSSPDRPRPPSRWPSTRTTAASSTTS